MDVAAIAKLYGKEYEREAIKYMAVERLLADFKLKSSRFKVRDTVNHGSIIGEWHTSKIQSISSPIAIYMLFGSLDMNRERNNSLPVIKTHGFPQCSVIERFCSYSI